MKKASLLVLALVAMLPGCCCRKNKESVNKPVRSNTVEKYMQTDVAVEEMNEDEDSSPDAKGEFDDEDIDYEEIWELINKEDNEGNVDLKENVDLDEDENVDSDDLGVEEDSDETAFNWIDAQTDDEFKKLYFSF